MSAYLKVLGLHVYSATTKKSYFGNDRYIEVNAQALKALRHTLSKDHLSIVSHCGSAFVVWSTLISPEQQMTNYVKKEPRRDESNQTCSWYKELTPLR